MRLPGVCTEGNRAYCPGGGGVLRLVVLARRLAVSGLLLLACGLVARLRRFGSLACVASPRRRSEGSKAASSVSGRLGITVP